MTKPFGTLNPSPRLLLGPGPSQISPRVLRACATPLLGYLDPEYLRLMDETQTLLREVFQTQNEWTVCAPGTGMAGMEAALIDRPEALADILFGHEYGDCFLEFLQDFENFSHERRLKPERGFVENEKPRIGHEGPADGDHALLPP